MSCSSDVRMLDGVLLGTEEECTSAAQLLGMTGKPGAGEAAGSVGGYTSSIEPVKSGLVSRLLSMSSSLLADACRSGAEN